MCCVDRLKRQPQAVIYSARKNLPEGQQYRNTIKEIESAELLLNNDMNAGKKS